MKKNYVIKKINIEILFLYDYIKTNIRIRVITRKEEIILKEFYIISNLSYKIIIDIDILKFNNINIR